MALTAARIHPEQKVDGSDPVPCFSNLRNLRNLWFQIRNLGIFGFWAQNRNLRDDFPPRD
jgi:hypothetical protein